MAQGKGDLHRQERCERLLNAGGTEREPEQWVALVERKRVCMSRH